MPPRHASGKRGAEAEMRLPPGLRLMFPPDRIAAAVDAAAASAAPMLAGARNPAAVCVLKGAFVFCADLIRRIPMDLDVFFIQASSYGEGTSSSGEVKIRLDLSADEIRGRDVLLVEDIVDTGRTLAEIRRRLAALGARVACSAVLLRRRRAASAPAEGPDVFGFEIGSEFVVGYGLDLAGKYRNLPCIAAVEEKPDQG